MPRQTSLLRFFLLPVALACGGDVGPPAPDAEFLVAAGDSTVWVRSGEPGMRSRGSAILLAELDGKFHEVYVADNDHSYFNAVFVGQRIYRRDLITGDSTVIYEDSVIPRLARAYGAQHPGEDRLAPDEAASDEPRSMATAEVEVLGLLGPYLSVAHHTDTHLEQGEEYHSTRHGVIDVREGSSVSIADLFGPAAADSIVAQGRRAFSAALDSILAARDTRASRAAESISGFEFDPSSWALYDDAGSPAVVFLVPGQGDRADGLALPLAPIRAPTPEWWHESVTATLPTQRSDSADTWTRDGYAVVASYATGSDVARLTVRDSAGRDWPASSVPLPVHRIHWLDAPPIDSLTRYALARAFDESVLYSDDARSVRQERPSRRPSLLLQVSHDSRSLPANSVRARSSTHHHAHVR